MLKLLKSAYKQVLERLERMQNAKRERTKNEILDDIALKILQLRTAQLDEIDLEELEEAHDLINTVYDDNCK